MRALTATELLRAWERGLSQSPPQRALTLLALGAEASLDQLALLSIGQRDVRLFALREQLFGPMITGAASCPDCGAQVELNFAVAAVCPASSPAPPESLTVSCDGYEIQCRLPNSLDLADLTSVEEVATHKRRLLERCVQRALCNGESIPGGEIPDGVADAVSERMAEADPQADVRLALACPECGHRWQAVLDVVSFLWAEIHAWAIRLLRDVHVLAATYGWREVDILALTPWRRQAYLDMIG